jgi:uncharacterized protein
MKKILSIDGGGIRGIIPGQILVALEEKLQKKTGNPEARIADYFDFIAGTSTGGILTCLYLCPDEKGRPKFSAKEAVELYVQHGGSIFARSFFQKVSSGIGIFDEKYSAAGLEKLLKKYFGDLTLNQLLGSCLITAYDIEGRKAHFFTKFKGKELNQSGNYLVRDVCRSTSAAPTYFEAASISSLTGERLALIDGGVFANNPALCAYSEIRNEFPDHTAKDMMIVSLSTGEIKKSYSHSTVKGYGKAGWIRPLIDIMMSASSEVNDYHVTKMFEAVKRTGSRADLYFRITPKGLGNADEDLDNASPENLRALSELGKKTAQEYDEMLESVAKLLVEGIITPSNGESLVTAAAI